ncbi:hypothetical lipoprotein [Metamycoplasma arthritidis]|uniref:lipoprotein 17-related variable surface protein n=2 Tax=Metamycoplasma arthritidis TaxID=2111 RepID=UPI0010052586|nr:lipoprotein 17-related variable surface protein [Metamycoplasma arthritidis]VEU79019.1 hypothetical lipoprotein [Metamycoplasma arthritidis]
MKKFKKNLSLLTVSILGTTLFATSVVAAACDDTKKKPEEPKKEDSKQKPDQKQEQGQEITELNNWLKSMSLKIVDGKIDAFYKAIEAKKDFYYSYSSKKLIAVEKGKRPNWREENEELLSLEGEFASNKHQIVNDEKPTYTDSKGMVKLSSLIRYEVKDGKIIFYFKGAIHDHKGAHKISTEVHKMEFPRQSLASNFEEYVKNLQFSYPNLEETLLDDVDIDKVHPSEDLKEGYEFAKKTIVKEPETNTLSILYSIRKKDIDYKSKNYVFNLKGWKKSSEMLKKIEEAKNKINEEINKLDIKILNEKAYQNIKETNSHLNFEGKSNFATGSYDVNLFKLEYVSVKFNETSKKIEVDVKLSIILDDSISVSKKLIIEGNYANGNINPHNLTEEDQKKYLSDELEKMTVHPYYSKDKTYIERLNDNELSDRSFWINNKNKSLTYTFGKVEKTLEGKYNVEVTTSFFDWNESPRETKKVLIDLEKLGIDIHNKIREQNNQAPLEDKKAPSGTVEENIDPDLNTEGFKETPSDDHNGGASSIIHLRNFIEDIKKQKLMLWDNEMLTQIKEKKYTLPFAQFFSYDKEKLELKSKVQFFSKSLKMVDGQTAFIISGPKEADGKLTIKLTLMTLQDFKAKNFNSENMISRRVEIDQTTFAKDYITKKFLLERYIRSLRLLFDCVGKEDMKPSEVEDSNMVILESHLPSGIKLIEKSTHDMKDKKGTLTIKCKFSYNGVETGDMFYTIKGFKKQ